MLSEGTFPERLVRQFLGDLGVPFLTNVRGLPGTPDIVANGSHAILVHGCFWHGHDCQAGGNFERQKTDASIVQSLKALGYRVCIIWECQLLENPKLVRSKLKYFLQSNSA